jgi:hypothetical protein
MAIRRCLKCGAPTELVKKCPHRHEIAKTARLLICGRAGCVNPAAVLWLTDSEHERYGSGERVFSCGFRYNAVLV